MADTPNLKVLQSLIKLANDENLSRSDFQKAFEQLVEVIKKQESKREAKIAQLVEDIKKVRDELKTQNDTQAKNALGRLEAELSRVKAENANDRAAIMQKLSEVRDGEDADEDEIVDRAVDRVKEELDLPTTEDLLNNVSAFGERIRNALELLEGDDRLDVSAIKGIEQMLKDIDGRIGKAVGSISVPSPVNWTRHQSISLSSGTTVYSLDDAPGHGGKAAIVRYEGQVLTETTHYSISGTDVTLTFDPNNSTKLDVTYWP